MRGRELFLFATTWEERERPRVRMRWRQERERELGKGEKELGKRREWSNKSRRVVAKER